MIISSLTLGPERKSAFIEQKNREVVAYHEGGHALVAHFTSGLVMIVISMTFFLAT